MSPFRSGEKSSNKLIRSSGRSIESDRAGTRREKQTSNQLMPADRIQTEMSGLDTGREEIAGNKLRGCGSESIEKDRPDIYSDGSLRRQESNLLDNMP